MSDFFTLENSKLSQEEKNIYSEKQWRWFQDTNNGVYNNQINFDLSGLFNAEGYTNPREMRLEIPLILVVSTLGQTSISGDLNGTVALKNGYYNIIDSMVLNYDNNVVQQATSNVNFYVSFDMMSKLSRADLDTIGHKIGFIPDQSEYWDYSDVATGTPNGNGIINTNNTAIAERASVYTQKPSNASREAKLTALGSFNTQFAPYTSGVQNIPAPAAGAPGLPAHSYQAWYITATIRLRDLSSFFDKMCLTKGFYGLLTFNMNMGHCILGKAAGTAAVAANVTVPQNPNNTVVNVVSTAKVGGILTLKSSNFRYNTCPFMISNKFSDNLLHSSTDDITIGLHLRRVVPTTGTLSQSSLGLSDHQMPTCRLYAPLIKLSPNVAVPYSDLHRSKYIEFDEIMSVPKPAIGAGESFNITISNSIINPIALLIVPIFSGTNDTASAGVKFNYASSLTPFDSCPATTMPLATLSNFNVQLGGKNIYNENVLYTYEMFENELSVHNKINGGQTYGLTSGLIDYKDYINNYRYYYVDLSRRTSESKEPKSIVVVGRNDTLVKIDLHIFVVRRRSVEINTETGRIIENTLTA